MNSLRILVADNYFLIREGLKQAIHLLEDTEVVGESVDYNGLILELGQKKPDIVLLEINLCDKPIKLLMSEIKDCSPSTKVLVMSDCVCELPVITAVKSGISGYIKKDVDREELHQALKIIAAGKEYFSPEISKILMDGLLNKNKTESTLTEREVEILRYICKGRSNEQIGDLLFVSDKTIATHKRNIMKKVGVKRTSDLILWALDNRVVERN
ncbi:MAG: response regulator transcription factor [Cytophagaceae bacterium]